MSDAEPMDDYKAAAYTLRDIRGLRCLEQELDRIDGTTIMSSILRTRAIDTAIAVLLEKSKSCAP